MKRKSTFLILVLAALSAVPAFGKEQSSGAFAAFWAWAIPWVDGRAVIDPNGLESGSCLDPWGGCHEESLSGEEGVAIDPFGPDAAGKPEGSGLDPYGAARGGEMDPNGKDAGWGIDPNG